ncbi:hypothetical protein JKF63_00407 [Porcisia hertigi]|uniref:Uncharacterized protein n=1 Tax=Porcisia hertigi TaxID=2761500 RepID=A0A836GY90_9TRYP|nr:hypothetical protein JKF63_00407 [Porcisia hertigi]
MPVSAVRGKGPAAGAKKKSLTSGSVFPTMPGAGVAAGAAPSSFAPRASGAGRASFPRLSGASAVVLDSNADGVSATASILRRATGSAVSSGAPVGAKKRSSVSIPRPPSSKPPSRGAGRKGGKGATVGGGSKRGSKSRGASATSRGTGATSKSRRTASSRGRGRGRGRGKSAKGRGKGSRLRRQLQIIAASLEALQEEEQAVRHGIEVEEELELESYSPIYNVLVMEIVRAQVEQVNIRQRRLNEMLEAFKREGLLGGGGVGLHDDQQASALVERLRERLHSDAVSEMEALKTRNSNLQHSLDEATLAIEKKSSELEILRANYAHKVARTDVDNDEMRARVQATLRTSMLDVERMKGELSRRIDIACAAIRTPSYNTSLEAMQELVQQVREEVQHHHDELTKLVVSIGAKDTFLKSNTDTMHTNLPSLYRAELRKLEKDQLLNLLDVLSFQEGVVDTVGKAIYVITEAQHKTAVM